MTLRWGPGVSLKVPQVVNSPAAEPLTRDSIFWPLTNLQVLSDSAGRGVGAEPHV